MLVPPAKAATPVPVIDPPNVPPPVKASVPASTAMVPVLVTLEVMVLVPVSVPAAAVFSSSPALMKVELLSS